MSQKSDNKKTGGLSAFINTLGGAIDDVMNEVKADLKAMTPPDQTANKKAAEQAAARNRIASILGQSTAGIEEITVEGAEDIEPLAPEPDPYAPEVPQKAPTGLPPGNLWQALANPQYTNRLRSDACYHALTMADVENYRRALAAESVAPYTMGVAAIVLQAPLEEELEEGGAIVADDLLLLSLLKALEETRLYGAIGAGPRQLWPSFDALDEALTNLLNNHPKLIALGPLGIDEPFAPYNLAQQKEQLAVQLDIAADFNLPVILSHRQSIAHMADVLGSTPQLPTLIWLDVLQSAEDLALVNRFGMYVVMRPELTVPDFKSAHLYRSVPEDKRLLASGSALVAPHGFQGHFNQPKFLTNTLQSTAKILFGTEKDVTATTNRNLASLFNKQ